MRSTIAATLGLATALALGTAHAAFAQTTTQTPGTTATAPAMGANTGAQTIGVDQMRGSKVIGASVYDRQNVKLGSVKDLILDKDGKVAEVVVSVGTTMGVGGKYAAVPFSSLKFDNDRLTLDQTKQQLQQAANFKLTDSNTGSGSSAVPPTGGHATGTSRSSSTPKP